jgi:hypothetical protein
LLRFICNLLIKNKRKGFSCMKKMFIAMAVLSTVFISAHEEGTKSVKNVLVVEEGLTCDSEDHDVKVDEEETALVCSDCDCKDHK